MELSTIKDVTCKVCGLETRRFIDDEADPKDWVCYACHLMERMEFLVSPEGGSHSLQAVIGSMLVAEVAQIAVNTVD
jgi:hypothetical protein